MSDIKQTIVVRKDLNMRKGKIGSQVGHASHLSLINLMRKMYVTDDNGNETIILQMEYGKDSYIGKWLEGEEYKKICLGCDSENELIHLYDVALSLGIPTIMVTDNGLTEFNGVKTNTCIVLGPFLDTEIDKVTSHLKPL